MNQKQSFGIMHQCYFVPRRQILDWINHLLNINITKIQQLGSGAIYCQILDIIHPGKVAITKLNWKAKNDMQFINNLKILQNTFEKIGIKKYVDVEKLAKAKYQDNLQFIQWLKIYYDTNGGDRGSNYNAAQRRGNCQVDFSFAEKTVVPKTYNGYGQVIGASKNEILLNKSSNMMPLNRMRVMQTNEMNNRDRSSSPENWQTRATNNEYKKKYKELLKMYERELETREQYERKFDEIFEALASGQSQCKKVWRFEEIMGLREEGSSIIKANQQEELTI